jgi:hypothetical protein
MTFAAAVQAHRDYLEATGVEDDPEAAILNFLEWEEPQDDFANEVAIVLVSADFSSELMTAVMWLSKHDIDISCVTLRPYIHADRILLDIQQKFPLPEAANYQIRIREKTREERQVREQSRDLTRYDLKIGDQIYRNLPKRRLAFHVIKEAVSRGAAPRTVLEGDRFWLVVSGEHDHDSLMAAADSSREPNSSSQGFRRFFTEDDELMTYDGKTYALTKQWGLRGPETAARVIEEFELDDVKFTEASEAPL